MGLKLLKLEDNGLESSKLVKELSVKHAFTCHYLHNFDAFVHSKWRFGKFPRKNVKVAVLRKNSFRRR
jgi:hypothetical protein